METTTSRSREQNTHKAEFRKLYSLTWLSFEVSFRIDMEFCIYPVEGMHTSEALAICIFQEPICIKQIITADI